ncbi:MAG: hypothetical protein SGJ27_05185 [Candidatus Melainabacteria bacterium]|nr:hypothetical protein [Candidatus Melainabacteria bacterium]
MNNQSSTNQTNVVDLFSKKHVVENNNVDYSLVDQLSRRRNSNSDKSVNRDNNLVVLFPGFCA